MSTMLKNIQLNLQYDGNNYYGWQLQNKSRRFITVQLELEKAIKKLFRENIRVISSGRTDKGVHARGQSVNFKVRTQIPKKNIKNGLNAYLPKDIHVNKVKFAPLDFHSRFKAKSKVYRYIILNSKNPDVLLRNYAWWVSKDLNLKFMRKASLALVGKKDLSSFTQEASSYKSCVRKIRKIAIKKNKECIYIDIEASGFLRGMARNIVSFLVDVGLGRIKPDLATRIIKARDRSLIGKPAPAYGLYLLRIYY